MRVLEYSSAASKQARAAPTAPKTIPKRASLRHESGPLQRLRARQHAVGRHAHVVEHELRRDRGAERHLLVDLRRGEPGRALLDDEAADLAVLGARPDDRDVGDRAVRDPHLGAVEDPVGPVAPCVRPHRARVGAGIRLGQAEAADHLTACACAAATAPSAPPSPSARSRTSQASPAPRRRCGFPSRPPRARGR